MKKILSALVVLATVLAGVAFADHNKCCQKGAACCQKDAACCKH